MFNWLSSSAPSLFAPSGGVTQQGGVWFYRYYPDAKTYLRYNSLTGYVYYISAAGASTQAGRLKDYL